ncbi:glycine oxidase ThiO [Kaarinaea lacus]
MTHLVIGGGIMGLLTAHYLNTAGEKVMLLEQGHLGQESSWAGGGILSPLYPWRYPDALNDLAAWSQQIYPALIEELKSLSDIDAQYWQCGFLILDEDEIEAAKQWAGQRNQNLLTVEANQMKDIAPNLSASRLPKNAIWMPDIAQARNPRLLKALITSLQNRGVELREQSAVDRLIISDQQIKAVVCGDRKFEAASVTVACGAWSSRLLKDYLPTLHVEPVRGQMILFKATPDILNTMIMEKAHYLIPRRDGRIIAGSTLEYVGFNKNTTEEAKQQLMKKATDLIPRLSSYPVEHHWSGLRPGNPQQVPFICQHPEISGLFINTGHFRNGVVTAPASAKLCTDQILNKTPILNPKPYKI